MSLVAIELSRKTGVPLYVQLKEKIRQQVESGSWEPGYKLPTERELANLLGVSRNTVSQAFRELEAEGILVIQQGKGTFLADADPGSIIASRIHRLEEIIQDALARALEEGFGCDDFVRVSAEVGLSRKELMAQVRIVFVECNREQVDYFSKQLELGSGVTIAAVVLDELTGGTAEAKEEIMMADMVVTTFFHEEEVGRLVPSDKQVLAVALDPQLETIVRIARIPRGSRIGLVCMSTTFAEKVVNSIRDAGIDNTPLVCTLACSSQELKDVVEKSDFLLVSPGRMREVAQMCPRPKELIEFVYRPDMGSVNLLKKAILEFRERGV